MCFVLNNSLFLLVKEGVGVVKGIECCPRGYKGVRLQLTIAATVVIVSMESLVGLTSPVWSPGWDSSVPYVGSIKIT